MSASWGVLAAYVLVGVTAGAGDANALGRRTIPPGKSVIINLDDNSGYCKFDFKTVMESGKSLVKRNVNICTLENYRITD